MKVWVSKIAPPARVWERCSEPGCELSSSLPSGTYWKPEGLVPHLKSSANRPAELARIGDTAFNFNRRGRDGLCGSEIVVRLGLPFRPGKLRACVEIIASP